jgi:peroxiredoxin
MKNIFRTLIAAVIAINMANAQNVGSTAPDFTLENLSDQNYTLSQNRGDVILVFLVGFNCSLCLASAPTVKSKIVDEFAGKSGFQTLVIDVWDGTKSGVKSFQDATNISATYLQNGSSVASSWESTKDRLFVIDKEGKIVFKGSTAARNDADAAKSAIQSALGGVTTSVDLVIDESGFSLAQNYPNPFQNQTTIEFLLGDDSEVNLSVFDMTGKKVLTPVHKYYPAGKYQVEVSANELNSGIYFYRFEAKGFVSTQKMIIQ